MKYVVILCDGMADYPVPQLNGKTPLEISKTPNMDCLAAYSELGLARTVPIGMKPGSDTANLSVIGYDPAVYYTGRSPLEALSIGVPMTDSDVATRCNLVTLGDEEGYENKTMKDYSSGEISTAESTELINYLKQYLDTDKLHFYAGVAYRHCLLHNDAQLGTDYTPPHDISDKVIKDYLPKGRYADMMLAMYKRSYELLKDHPVNVKRRAEGKHTADSIWLWGEGVKPNLTSFEQKNGVKGGIISAVDLLKGIAVGAQMRVINVEGANGMLNTDYKGKGQAALDNLADGLDYVYIHVEAPDEMGHQGLLDCKIQAIENIDRDIVGPVYRGLAESEQDFRILICPDHPTPMATRTHAMDPVPYMIFDSRAVKKHNRLYNEKTCAESGVFVEKGCTLIDKLLEK